MADKHISPDKIKIFPITMASIFTFQEDPRRVRSPWSTPGSSTPQSGDDPGRGPTDQLRALRLEPERESGSVEYKLHLLIRHPTTAGRQLRLRQLTTQLLWRLQQSAPFQSSTNANLILPVLPEAPSQLGMPERPASILPGLEESQGALYEIGVADDGALTGLIEEELNESLNNLRVMAASIGCVIEVIQKLCVGRAHSTSPSYTGRALEKAWVAEVLVRPDTSQHADTRPFVAAVSSGTLGETAHVSQTAVPAEAHSKQMRVALIGASRAGKSSLLGCLTTSTLDNGRGKSRKSLLRHRHELASGVTSSVTHEIIGYSKSPKDVTALINYAQDDVGTWLDVHDRSERLVFLSDSPGLPKYAKSTFRTLVSWKPQWTLLCVAADEQEQPGVRTSDVVHNGHLAGGQYDPELGVPVDLTLAHFDLCFKLGLPSVVVITKMDVATRTGFRAVLNKVLTAIKAAGRIPKIVPSAPSAPGSMHLPDLEDIGETAEHEIDDLCRFIQTEGLTTVVPIVLTSAISGIGISKLHLLLSCLAIFGDREDEDNDHQSDDRNAFFHIDEVFSISPTKVYSSADGSSFHSNGIVLSGICQESIAVGDQFNMGPFMVESGGIDRPGAVQRSLSSSVPMAMPRSAWGELSRSLPPDDSPLSRLLPVFIRTKVVSLRNLRLPVRTMKRGQTGTLGIELVDGQASPTLLNRARKGMVLLDGDQDAIGYRSFTASFSAADFADVLSPTLILGGLAIIYVNSVRAAVKVLSMTTDSTEDMSEQLATSGSFEFDDADPEKDGSYDRQHDHGRDNSIISITFKFVSTVEWMGKGNRILVVPTMTAAGPVAGPAVTTTGLSGFVGTITDVFS